MAGWIGWGLLALLLLLLCAPAVVEVVYRESLLRVRLRVLGLPVTLYPQKPRKPKKPKKQKPPVPEPAEQAEPKKKTTAPPLMDLLALVSDLLPQVGRLLGHLTRALHVRRCRVTLPVTGEDAAEVGIRYGQMSAICYNIYIYMASAVKLREWSVELIPDFTGENPPPLAAQLAVAASPVVLLWAVLRFMVRGGLTLYRSPVVQAKAAHKPPKGKTQKKRKVQSNGTNPNR